MITTFESIAINIVVNDLFVLLISVSFVASLYLFMGETNMARSFILTVFIASAVLGPIVVIQATAWGFLDNEEAFWTLLMSIALAVFTAWLATKMDSDE